MATWTDLVGARELLLNLTQRELRTKYKRSVLGWAWSMINPIMLAIMFTVFFTVILGQQASPGNPSGLRNYPLFLLCALLPWNFLSNSITGSIGALVGNANLVKKVYFPREVLVVSTVLSWGVSFLIELGVLVAALLIFGNMVFPWLPVVAVLIALQTLFATGLGMVFAALNVYFRDVQHFVGILMQLWFYASPIIYPMDFVQAHDRTILGVDLVTVYKLNPMVGFVDGYRSALYDLAWPSPTSLAYVAVVSVAVFLAGRALFGRLEPRLAEEL